MSATSVVPTRIAAIAAARRAVRLGIVRMPVVPPPAIAPLAIVQVVHARRPSINGRPATIATRRARSVRRVTVPRAIVLRVTARVRTAVPMPIMVPILMVIAREAPILTATARKVTVLRVIVPKVIVPKVIVRKPRARPGRVVASAVAAEPVAVVAAVVLPDK